jgi:hypothetical protein
MKKRITGFLLLLVFVASCKKLPEETHKGRNIMACYVNGENWIAKNGFWPGTSHTSTSWGGTTSYSPSVVITDNYFKIYGVGKKEYQGAISLYIQKPSFSGVGVYSLSPHNYSLSGANIKIYNRATYTIRGNDFHTDSIRMGEVNIKYYEEGKLCSGTFNFEAINQKGEIVKITDGRFDISIFAYP